MRAATITTNLPPTVALQEEAIHAAETALLLSPILAKAGSREVLSLWMRAGFRASDGCYENARQFLPNSSQVPESLAFAHTGSGQWDRLRVLLQRGRTARPAQCQSATRHGQFYIALRRFPEALGKPSTRFWRLCLTTSMLWWKRRRLPRPRATCREPRRSSPTLQPAAGDPTAWETIAYQAILERQTAEIIPRSKSCWRSRSGLGLSQWRAPLLVRLGPGNCRRPRRRPTNLGEARVELEAFLKEQPENAPFSMISP